jgi:CRP-like cAMP-binding protein
MPRSLPSRQGDRAAYVHKPNPLGENRLLSRLGTRDRSWLQPHLKKISLARGTVLHPAGVVIERVYFPLSGMVSVLAIMKTGEAIETAIIGREGVVGASVGIEGSQSFGQAIVQITGSAWQMSAAKFVAISKASASFRTLMNGYQSVVLLQAQQSAACHALHNVEARLCRWLLHSQDATEDTQLTLTQEFLSHMMGVRRASVSLSAHALQKAGLIKYSRGEIEIVDRNGLEDSACECYEAVREHIDKAVPRR